MIGEALTAHYAGKVNNWTVVFIDGGWEVKMWDSPTEPPPTRAELAQILADYEATHEPVPDLHEIVDALVDSVSAPPGSPLADVKRRLGK